MANIRLTVPASGVEETPLVSISVNAAWLEAILSSVSILESPDQWAEGADYDAVETQLFTLYSIIVNAS